MSINTAHANCGVLLHSDEYILLYVEKATMEFFGQQGVLYRREKCGRIYLTSHRLIFVSNVISEPLQSFSAPYISISDLRLLQYTDNVKFIRGLVHPQPNGNFIGQVEFKLYMFKGIDEWAKAMVTAGSLSLQNLICECEKAPKLPPYKPTRAWYDAPLVAYQLPKGYFDWLPTNSNFTSPAPDSVYLCDNIAPFPGIRLPTITHIRKAPCEPFGKLDGAGDPDTGASIFSRVRDSRLIHDEGKYRSHWHRSQIQQTDSRISNSPRFTCSSR